MHHIPGLWNGIWSDMYIETTFMRYGYGKRGIIGVTLKPETMKIWSLSLHICSKLEQDLVCQIEPDDNGKQDKHKEESKGRIDSDKIRWIETPFGEGCKNATTQCLLMTIHLKWLILFLENSTKKQ